MKSKNSKPILFSTEMVQAILAGRKTQTRRVCPHQYWSHSELTDFNINEIHNKVDRSVSSRYQPGEILWVRETFCESVTPDIPGESKWKWCYRADSNLPVVVKWKPSLFMPKEAARIFLKVTNVRVERLQDISEEDAIAEGVELGDPNKAICFKHYGKPNRFLLFAKQSFETLWQSINGKKHPWDSNPWVWVYTFEQTEKPENFLS